MGPDLQKLMDAHYASTHFDAEPTEDEALEATADEQEND